MSILQDCRTSYIFIIYLLKFYKAYIIDSDDLIVSKIRDSNYAGDILFLSRLENDKKASSNALLWSPDQSLSSNMRLRVSYQVLRFDSNNLEIIVNMPQPEPSWMLYSDVWHPFWKATVNGRLTQVSKANLAYKAIQLERGLNKVHFYFNSNPMSLLHLFFGFNALLWIGIIIWALGKICSVGKFP